MCVVNYISLVKQIKDVKQKEKYVVFKNGKTQYCYYLNFSQTIDGINIILINIPTGLLYRNQKLILQLI